MVDIEKISVKKFIEKAKKLENDYGVSLDIYRAESNIRSHFISKMSVENNGIDIEKLVSNEDMTKLRRDVDTLAEARNIVKKYLKKDSKDMRIEQINYISLPNKLLEAEAKKMKLSAWDFRYTDKVSLETIEGILLKKTNKYIPLHLGDSIHSYQTYRELNELFQLLYGYETDISGQNWSESVKECERRLNAANPMMEIKVFQNGNFRFVLKDKQAHEHFRHFLIDREMASIVRSRNSRM